SPDGTKAVYQGPAQGQLQLLVRSLQSENPQVLSGTENAANPCWSADSRSIGFFSSAKLNRVTVSGGVAQTVADAIAPRGCAWNDDGVILFSSGVPLMRVSAVGGQPVEVTTV